MYRTASGILPFSAFFSFFCSGIIRTFSTSLLFTGKLSRNWKRLFSLTWTWTFMVSDFEGLWRGQKHAMKRKQNWIDIEKFCIYFTLLFKKVTFSCCGTNFLNSMILRFSIFFTQFLLSPSWYNSLGLQIKCYLIKSYLNLSLGYQL